LANKIEVMSIATTTPNVTSPVKGSWVKPVINIISINDNTLGGTADTADGGATDNS
jgi:hypothetical protein